MRFAMGAVATFRGAVRIRRCGRKQKHWSAAAAVRHLASLRHRFGQQVDCLTIYRCRDCGAWHVGRRKVAS
jgi:hypothetical protein